MQKIPTIFVRDMSKQPSLVTPEWNSDCLWVRDGEGKATRKWDGSSCLWRGGRLYRRRELRPGDVAPTDFESLGTDENTGKTVGWVPVGDDPDDKWHRQALGELTVLVDGATYELVGPKVNGGKDGQIIHCFQKHGETSADAGAFKPVPRDFDGIREWLAEHVMEGIVWHHPDGRMAKIKRRDFGLRW